MELCLVGKSVANYIRSGMNLIDEKRIRRLNDASEVPGAVVYWMSRDQRVRDNWALLYARQLAEKFNTPLAALFCLVPRYLGASEMHYRFMLEGLRELEQELVRFGIPFYIRSGPPQELIPEFVNRHDVGALVTDFSPLRLNRRWKRAVSKKISIPFYEVDAHNIIPCWVVSEKQEYAAYTFRPKVHRLLPQFLTEYPRLKKMTVGWPGGSARNDWGEIFRSVKARSHGNVSELFIPGDKAAAKAMRRFLRNTFVDYDSKRNDPNHDGQSQLSPYFHFGQISCQRVALEIQRRNDNAKSQESYLEELIVRRELSDNFCFYNQEYDNFDGFPEWAKKTLDEHRGDRREFIYSRAELERGCTHDPLWNAAQWEMVYKGKMHGFMRMYWAKKILEWSVSPEQALETAIYLNDRYELDGRDPNGYTGIAWSVGGVHDRAWPERDIFGKIRYMSFDGCRRKFDINGYIRKIEDIKCRVSR